VNRTADDASVAVDMERRAAMKIRVHPCRRMANKFIQMVMPHDDRLLPDSR
jgi:hypothetical protein